MKATAYDSIQVAENEWGSGIMREIAEEWFAAHPSCNFVEVREHGGWFLGYHRSGQIISTANDMAVLPKDRPRPTHFSGCSYRRPVLMPDCREVNTLAQYKPLKQVG